jgi:hypothetical protein
MKNATTIFDEESDMEIALPTMNEICHRCDGEGVHTNPSIDGNGISTDDEIWQDEDFRDDYMTGAYDILCEICGGNKVIKVVDRDRCDPAKLAQFDREQEEIWAMDAMDAAERAAGC